MKIIKSNRMAPDGTSRFAASHLGLFCLPMSHKKTLGLYGLMKYLKNRNTSLVSDIDECHYVVKR